MADERYAWLDAEAAERLLRGEPVGPVGDRARADAHLLAAALSEAGAEPSAGGELPGEAAALAAFRDASRAGRHDGAGARRAVLSRPAVVAGPGAQPGTLPTVRVGATRTAASRGPRWSRPLRYGLVVSLAGCALGGVAVAAGTGMLPEAFGGRHSPAPAASVSMTASPKAPAPGLPLTAGPSVSPPVTPDTSGSAAPAVPSDAPETGTSTEGSVPSGPTARGPARDGGAPGGGGDRGGSEGTSDGDGFPGGSSGSGGSGGSGGLGDGDSREVYEKSVKACRDYRDDSLDGESRRRLVRLAKGERNLDHFCDRILKEGGRTAGESSGGGRGDTGEGGGKDAGEGRGAGKRGLNPSISFERAPGSERPPGSRRPAGDVTALADGEDADGSSTEPSVRESAVLAPTAG